jgi:beta-glucanase (GH16 family)
MDMVLKNNFWLTKFVVLWLIILVLTGCSADPDLQTAPPVVQSPQPTLEPTQEPTPEPPPEWELEGWTLIWQDEFDGEELDPSRWEMEIGGHGWGNNEWQFYTDRPENVRLEDGFLVIEARDEFFVRRNYTSGRIKTQNLFSFTYGRVEARMKLPYGQGIWPAFWMLGEDITTVPWPASGEIDIMEHIGRQPRHIHGTVHGPGYSGSGGIGHYKVFPEATLSEEFHTYAIEWEPGEIRWYVDDEQFFRLTPEQVRGEWVFDKPYFLLINLAVGGNWPGYPDDTTTFPQFLTVEYVRVYQRPEMAAGFEPIQPGGAMRVAEISAEALQGDDGWQAAVNILILDEDGNPIPNVRVDGGWVGVVIRGETTGLTDEDGQLRLYSDFTDRSGEITFCVTRVMRNGFTYDRLDNIANCAKVEQ